LIVWQTFVVEQIMWQQLANAIENKKTSLSFAKASLIYWGVMLVSYPLVSGIASKTYGNDAWQAGLVAMLICSVAGFAALVITSKREVGIKGTSRILLGMIVGLFIPITGMVVIDKQFEELKIGAPLGQLVVFFLIMLTTQTALTLQMKPSQTTLVSTSPSETEVSRHG
jgi:hypothetical protein